MKSASPHSYRLLGCPTPAQQVLLDLSKTICPLCVIAFPSGLPSPSHGQHEIEVATFAAG